MRKVPPNPRIRSKDPAAKAREEHEATESFEVVLEFPRYQPQGTILLKGATLITMKGMKSSRKATSWSPTTESALSVATCPARPELAFST